VNALYPSTLLGYLPHSDFKVYSPGTGVHSFIQTKLIEGDVGFFHNLLTKKNIGFHMKVSLKFGQENSFLFNCDLSGFPKKRIVTPAELSESQRIAAQFYNRFSKNQIFFRLHGIK
jgi:hypothetical protein